MGPVGLPAPNPVNLQSSEANFLAELNRTWRKDNFSPYQLSSPKYAEHCDTAKHCQKRVQERLMPTNTRQIQQIEAIRQFSIQHSRASA